jgi:hypothetical protein
LGNMSKKTGGLQAGNHYLSNHSNRCLRDIGIKKINNHPTQVRNHDQH